MSGWIRGAAAAVVAVSVMALAAPAQAQGYYYRRGPSPGAAAALGVVGGVALGAAIASSARPRYAPIAPGYAAPVAEEECYVERRRVFVPGWGWEVRRRTVCE